MNTKEQLLEHLEKNTKVLKDDLVREAFTEVDRKDFVPDELHVEAYEDYPLPIGEGQTISQPTTVAFMLEILKVKGGNRVLDIGSGSGWTTALLAHIVGKAGEVIGVERIPKLVKFGKENLKKYNFKHARIEEAKEGIGKPYSKLFDRILVSASAPDTGDVEELLHQLAVGGFLVIPIGDSIFRFEKESENSVEQKEYPGFVFVPLIDD